ncbi:hypothetical protein B0T10DRAFT_461535 [Thelonectria olida]|uniref:Uncharacterized protein n=1 Tax=Thelonectria olida TaxID=1576542 RepID=A0A9P8W4K1_9HYPO|nr:hypothetical protein B0T10DRAFT_461535 [Thelonectria olida]
MISASDQILVSQFAILIAAFAGFDGITLYSADIIIGLAVLSSAVHLSTIPFLVDRLQQQTWIKFVRVLMMWLASFMLIFSLMMQFSVSWSTDGHTFVLCAAKSFKVNPGEDFFGFGQDLIVSLFILFSAYDVTRLLYSRHPETQLNTVATHGVVLNQNFSPNPEAGDLGQQQTRINGREPTSSNAEGTALAPLDFSENLLSAFFRNCSSQRRSILHQAMLQRGAAGLSQT